MLFAHGTPEQTGRFVEAMTLGHQTFAQMLSEPDAGSDLAGVRTRAERDGDERVVTGRDQPGIEVRPLRQMTGDATFNQVFLTAARVPAGDVLGESSKGVGGGQSLSVGHGIASAL